MVHASDCLFCVWGGLSVIWFGACVREFVVTVCVVCGYCTAIPLLAGELQPPGEQRVQRGYPALHDDDEREGNLIRAH